MGGHSVVGDDQHVDLISESLSLQVVEKLLQLFANVDKTLSHLERLGTSRVPHVVDVLPVRLRTHKRGRNCLSQNNWPSALNPVGSSSNEVNAINSSATQRASQKLVK
jgi:hypothetical protein